MLHFDRDASDTELRRALVECGRICYERRLIASNDGNLSVRLREDTVLITPSGAAKGRMRADDILEIDLDGRPTGNRPGAKPSSETPMHLEVYKQRKDARAVIHAHPVFATALTVAGHDFPADVLPEILLLLGDVPITDYATPASGDDAAAVRPYIRDHKAILLRQHGSLTCGADLEEALVHLERVEHVAEVYWRASGLGHVERLSADARRQLKATRGAAPKE